MAVSHGAAVPAVVPLLPGLLVAAVEQLVPELLLLPPVVLQAELADEPAGRAEHVLAGLASLLPVQEDQHYCCR